MSNKPQLTDWEVGQELIAITDYMCDHSRDFKHSHPEIYEMILEARKTIGDKFNSIKTHSFGLLSHDMESK